MNAQPPPTGLPIEAIVPQVRDALGATGHAVLVAPPGSGKTTVVPLRLLGESWLGDRKIVVLEPRRLATRAAARWMAHMLGEQAGDTVGYVTRTDRRVGPATRIEVVTEGVLTRRLQRDPELADTAAVVFDELHERNQQTDLGLALALDARRVVRPDLRVLAMSATIDAHRIAELLGGEGSPAPVIVGDARTYPVDVRWSPVRRNAKWEAHAASVIRGVLETEQGDVLVFLPGMGEIRRIERMLGDVGVAADVRVLHGSLPLAEQDAAIAPSVVRRKVVLSTDIAETSLTVEGIRVVVDSGLARAPRFDSRTGMTRLRTISISRASADQRAGRAGRVAPGVAIRLWSKLEHSARKPHIVPEIAEVDLAGMALELAAWGTPDPGDMPFLDPPPARTYAEARKLLHDLGALDDAGRMTTSGRAMANLPLHPRLARMVVDAGHDAELACMIAAIVDDRDIFRGHPNEVPVGLTERVWLVEDAAATHPQADRRGIDRVRRTARDLARRSGVARGEIDLTQVGAVLSLGFPDRLAVRRGSPGRFQLRTGTTAWMRDSDPLATAQFLVVSDLDGKRKDARIRLAAAIEPDEVAARFASEVDERVRLVWEQRRLVERREQRLGGMTLRSTERRPTSGPDVVGALVRRLRDTDLRDLPWSKAAETLCARVAFLHRAAPDEWPDWSRSGLRHTVDQWLGPALVTATGIDDLESIDLRATLLRNLGHQQVAALDKAAPPSLMLPGGRSATIDYRGDVPAIALRVQDLFGTKRHPTVAGIPVQLQLLSPAGRPVQITQDLPGFWDGSWHDVRKDMAGRYPKHDWPEDPANAKPGGERRRRR